MCVYVCRGGERNLICIALDFASRVFFSLVFSESSISLIQIAFNSMYILAVKLDITFNKICNSVVLLSYKY